MANTVEVKGGGDFDGAILRNAATEATLLKLVEVLDKKQKGTGDKIQEIYNKVLNKNIEAIEESTDKHEEYLKTLKNTKSTLEKFEDTLTDITKSAVSGIFTGIVATGTALLDFFKNGFTAFQETNKVGASFNYDLLELRRAAVAAAMPLDEFTKFITENSRSLAALGGTVTDGAKTFSQLREQFTDPSSSLYELGFTGSELNKILAEELKTQTALGKAREIDGNKFSKELTDYAKDLTKLSKVTGISTETLQAGATAQAADGRMIGLSSKLAGKELKNFQAGLALMNSTLDPKVFDTLKNMMSGVIDPADKFGAMLTLAAPGIMEFQQAIAGGNLTIEQQLQGYERQVAQIGNFLGRFSKQQIARIPELKAMEEYLASIKKFTGANGRANLENEKAMKGIISLFSKFSEIINRVMNLFTKAFINSKTMERIQEAFNRLSAFIDKKGPDIIKKLEPVMDEIGHWIDFVVDGLIGFGEAFIRGDLKPENIWKWVKDSFGGAIKIVTDGIGAVIGGLLGTTPEQQAQKDAYRQASPEEQAKMRQQNPALGMPDFGGIFDKMASGLKSLVAMVPTLGDLALFFGVVGGGTMVAGMGLAAGITAVATAMGGLAVPALAVGAAIGMGAGGLGYALNGVANIINSVSDGFSRLGEFFKSMGDADPAKMKNASDSIKGLASSMSDLAASGLVGLITGGTLSGLADTLTKFALIDYNRFSTAGTALGVLHDGLTKFTGGVIDSITGFFSTDGGLDAVIKSLTKLNDIDLNRLQGVAALGKFFESLKPFLDPEMVTKLPNSLQMIKDSLDTFSQSITTSVNNLAGNTGLKNVIEAFEQLGSLSTSLSNANLSVGIKAVIDNLRQLNGFDLQALDNSKINALANSLKNLNSIDLGSLDGNKISSLSNTLQMFNTLDVTKITQTINALNSTKITLGDNLNTQSSEVDNFVKSVNNLVDSLKTLESQMKINATISKVPTSFPNDLTVNQQEAAQRPKAIENLADDPTRTLNTKLDQMITILTEMKTNTKDTADAVSNRKNAL